MEVEGLPLLLGVVDGVEHRRLQSGEGHIQRVVGHVGAGKYIGFIIAPLGHFVHGPAAGIAQTQHPGGLVKALPRRVVPGGAQHREMGVVANVHDGGGAAGHAQAQEGGLQVGVGDVIGGDVPPDVVDGDERHAQAKGGGLGEGYPHQ